MRIAEEIVFRRITSADFFNIYKAPSQQQGGGGQSYIDVDTSGVSVSEWRSFFGSLPETQMTGGPVWQVPIRSLGSGHRQEIKIGQRRSTSVSIRSQKIHSRAGNRVRAWHPNYTGFPQPTGPLSSSGDRAIAPLIQGLVIYIVRDTRDEYWAGWFKAKKPLPTWDVDPQLLRMFAEDEGVISLDPGIWFNETNVVWPFTTHGGAQAKINPFERKKAGTGSRAISKAKRLQGDEAIIGNLFDQDEVIDPTPHTRTKIQRVRKRNMAAVRKLKNLYGGKCQITGEEFIFEKSNGEPYTEAHHLVPLGRGGADSPHNLIVISAHVHRMLHFAEVSDIDLTLIKRHQLSITINDKNYSIKWHPKHAEAVRAAARKGTR